MTTTPPQHTAENDAKCPCGPARVNAATTPCHLSCLRHMSPSVIPPVMTLSEEQPR